MTHTWANIVRKLWYEENDCPFGPPTHISLMDQNHNRTVSTYYYTFITIYTLTGQLVKNYTHTLLQVLFHHC